MRHPVLFLVLALTITARSEMGRAQTAPPKAASAKKPATGQKPPPATKTPATKPPAAKKLTPAQEQAAKSAFEAGVEAMKKEKYAEALVQFQQVLKIDPDETSALWNAGSAAFFVSDYKNAATYFERELKQEPHDGHLLAKLIQTYQALGDTAHRDARRSQLFTLYHQGKDESGYTKDGFYCRDQFTVGSDAVFALERFDLKPQIQTAGQNLFGTRYEFYVQAPEAEQPKMRLDVGWNTLEADGKGGFKPTNDTLTAFYFDAYYPTGDYSRKTFGLFAKEMPYEAVKQKLLDIVSGKAEMVSGRRRDETGPGN